MTALRRLAALATLGTLAACATMPPPQPDPTGLANAEMLRVLTALAGMNPKPIETLTPAEARQQPTAAMAATAVQGQVTGSTAPMLVAQVQDIQVPGAAGPLPARLYNPRPGAGPLPVILYFQGGGWVIADLDTYDASARALAAGTGAIVLSVQYRKGPENKFPAAHDDAAASYEWLHANAARIGGDPRRLAIAGESAGGNLTIATAVAARDRGLPMPVALVSIYPAADTRSDLPTETQFTTAKPLDTPMLAWFVKYYTNGTAQEKQDPRLNLVGTADLHGLPPTTVILAEIDPLRSGGERLAQKLQAAGMATQVRTYPGVTHEFFGMGSVVSQAKAAEDFAAAQLRQAFAQTSTTRQPVRMMRGRPVYAPAAR